MNIPSPINHWLQEKVENHRWAGVVSKRTITHSWRKATGGMIMFAELSATIEPSSGFALEIEAAEIESSFIQGASNGAISVLMSQSHSPVLACHLKLHNFKPDQVGSSYVAFYNAAFEATEMLLGVDSKNENNILW